MENQVDVEPIFLRIVFSSKDENITNVEQVKIERTFSKDDMSMAEDLVKEIKSTGKFSFYSDVEFLIGFNNTGINKTI